jgi:predicted nucleic acid-binding protein
VCDAGPLIHLDELRCLDLLNAFTEILVPEAVWNEVKAHQPSSLRRRRVHLQLVHDVPQASAELRASVASLDLGAGEEQAFRLMQVHPTATLLTDDNAARLLAEMLHYQIYGTLGIVLQGLQLGLRTKRQTLNILRRLPEKSTLYVRRALLDAVIARVRDASL